MAIKICLKEFSGRFEREARAISALNHPHICTLYDMGPNYLVMEFVEGETLAARLKKGPLPVELVLRYGVEITDALAEAHSRGIIHRDLKPGNVMLTKAGVKVLDFGLAKFTQPDAPAAKLGEIETASHVVMGTPAYMAPEQALGRELDERADLFSLGVVLYEMATGTRPFQGDTPTAMIDAILHQVPAPPAQVNPSIPAGLAQIIERALEKDLEVRYQTASGIRADLKRLIRDMGSGGLVSAPLALVAPRRRWSYIVAGAVILTAVSAGVIWWRTRTPISLPQPALMRLTSDSGLTTDPALSPDGKFVAYASDRAGGDNLDIWIKQVDGGVPLRLTSDPADESEPSFSPDGNRIVFRSEREGGGIYTMPALGGDPRLVAKGGLNPRFSPDGTRIAFVRKTALGEPSLFVVPSAGGRPEPLAPGGIGASYPVWSPDGRFILIAAGFYRIEDWAVVPSEPSPRVAVSTVSLTAAKKAGLADLMPREWLAGNRILFSAKSGDSSQIFEIGLSPPALTAKQWRLELPPKRLTFGTSQDEKPSVASGGSRLRRPPFGLRQSGQERELVEHRSGYQSTPDRGEAPAVDSGERFPHFPVDFCGRNEAGVYISRRLQR